jgi:hypothetical protein
MARRSSDREAIKAEIDRVRSLGLDELRTLWRTTLRSSPPPAFTKDLVARFLCWHIQEQALGGLDPDTAKLLEALSKAIRRTFGRASARIGLEAAGICARTAHVGHSRPCRSPPHASQSAAAHMHQECRRGARRVIRKFKLLILGEIHAAGNTNGPQMEGVNDQRRRSSPTRVAGWTRSPDFPDTGRLSLLARGNFPVPARREIALNSLIQWELLGWKCRCNAQN